MKKILLFMMTTALLLSFTACNQAKTKTVTLHIEESGILGQYTLEAEDNVVQTITQITTMDCTGFVEGQLEIIEEAEAFRTMDFYDIGAFVWFAHIIEWEFNHFSVEKCFDKLLDMQRVIDEKGYIEGTIHRYLIVARKG